MYSVEGFAHVQRCCYCSLRWSVFVEAICDYAVYMVQRCCCGSVLPETVLVFWKHDVACDVWEYDFFEGFS